MVEVKEVGLLGLDGEHEWRTSENVTWAVTMTHRLFVEKGRIFWYNDVWRK